MKKLLAVLMTLCLLWTLPAVAEEEIAPLTADEVSAYLEELRLIALADENLTVVPGENGMYNATFAGGMLVLADDALRADTAIVGAQLDNSQPDMRQMSAAVQVNEVSEGSTLADVLATYPCDNAELYGTYEEAVVAISGSLPGTAFVGLVQREGQHVQNVVYYAYETVGEDTMRANITYHFAENNLITVTVTAAEMVEDGPGELAAFALLQEERGYFAYPSSQDGSVLDIFVREDLSFSGVDFLSMTAEDLSERFGEPKQDAWLEDTDGSYIRTCAWDGIELTMQYDADKNFVGTRVLNVMTDLLEGPRGVRIGDSVTSLLFRFRHGDGATEGGVTVLYGESGAAPYGELSYQDSGAYMTYLAQVPDGTVALYLNCENMYMTSYMLAVLDAE